MNERLRVWELAAESLNGRGEPEFLDRFRQVAATQPEFWPQIISVANANLVTSSFWSALRRYGLAEDAPTNAAEYLQSFHDLNSARNRELLQQLFECVAAFNRRGIEPMLLKGAAYLTTNLYADVGDRFLSDIDLLVPTDSADRARPILDELGYRPATDIDYSDHHHLPPMLREQGPAALEVHTAPVPSFAQPALPTASLWSDAAHGSADGVRFRIPSPTDAAMLSFLHAEVVDCNLSLCLIPLRLFHDLHLLGQRYGDDIDWNENFAKAATIGAEKKLRRYLHVLHRISATQPFDGLAPSILDQIHFSLCRAAVARPVIIRNAVRLDRLTERRIRKKYGVTGGVAAVNRYRLREISEMLARAFGRK